MEVQVVWSYQQPGQQGAAIYTKRFLAAIPWGLECWVSGGVLRRSCHVFSQRPFFLSFCFICVALSCRHGEQPHGPGGGHRGDRNEALHQLDGRVVPCWEWGVGPYDYPQILPICNPPAVVPKFTPLLTPKHYQAASSLAPGSRL